MNRKPPHQDELLDTGGSEPSKVRDMFGDKHPLAQAMNPVIFESGVDKI